MNDLDDDDFDTEESVQNCVRESMTTASNNLIREHILSNLVNIQNKRMNQSLYKNDRKNMLSGNDIMSSNENPFNILTVRSQGTIDSTQPQS